MALKFDYCECGCKGYEASIGDREYWIYWALKCTDPKPYFLRLGHGFSGRDLGRFDTYELAQEAATKDAEKVLTAMLHKLAL